MPYGDGEEMEATGKDSFFKTFGSEGKEIDKVYKGVIFKGGTLNIFTGQQEGIHKLCHISELWIFIQIKGLDS